MNSELKERVNKLLRLLRKDGYVARKVDSGGVNETFSTKIRRCIEDAGKDPDTAAWVGVDTWKFDGKEDYIYYGAGSKHDDDWEKLTQDILYTCKLAGLHTRWEGTFNRAIIVTLPE